MFFSHPPQIVASNLWFYTANAPSDEMYNYSIMEGELTGDTG